MTPLLTARPCTAREDTEPGVRLNQAGELLKRLSPNEARALGADLILAAGASEAQWGTARGAEAGPA